MSFFDFCRLVLLSAIWGGSFLFVRVSAPEFGPFPLIWLRVSIAALVLFPLFFQKKVRGELRQNWGKLLIVGLFNAAIPFTLLAWAMLSLEAGFTSLLNAATPLFAAMIGFVWLRHGLSRWQVFGIVLGIVGVAILAGNRFSFRDGGSGWAILATLAATASYGFVSHYSKRYLVGVSSWGVTLGNLTGAALVLAPMAWWTWPSEVPSVTAIGCAAALAVLSTAIAFVLLFDLLSRAGATAVTTVTFIIPIFGVLFGAVFLGEDVTLRMSVGMVVALLGAALTTKMLPRPSL